MWRLFGRSKCWIFGKWGKNCLSFSPKMSVYILIVNTYKNRVNYWNSIHNYIVCTCIKISVHRAKKYFLCISRRLNLLFYFVARFWPVLPSSDLFSSFLLTFSLILVCISFPQPPLPSGNPYVPPFPQRGRPQPPVNVDGQCPLHSKMKGSILPSLSHPSSPRKAKRSSKGNSKARYQPLKEKRTSHSSQRKLPITTKTTATMTTTGNNSHPVTSYLTPSTSKSCPKPHRCPSDPSLPSPLTTMETNDTC